MKMKFRDEGKSLETIELTRGRLCLSFTQVFSVKYDEYFVVELTQDERRALKAAL